MRKGPLMTTPRGLRLEQQRVAAEAARAVRERERYLRELDEEIDRDIAAEAQPRPAESDEAWRARVERESRMSISELIEAAPREPIGAGQRAQDKRIRRAEREDADRESREAAAGIPKARANWESRRETIDRRRDAAIRTENERHANELRAIAERAEGELADLGEYPSLKDEAVAA